MLRFLLLLLAVLLALLLVLRVRLPAVLWPLLTILRPLLTILRFLLAVALLRFGLLARLLAAAVGVAAVSAVSVGVAAVSAVAITVLIAAVAVGVATGALRLFLLFLFVETGERILTEDVGVFCWLFFVGLLLERERLLTGFIQGNHLEGT